MKYYRRLYDGGHKPPLPPYKMSVNFRSFPLALEGAFPSGADGFSPPDPSQRLKKPWKGQASPLLSKGIFLQVFINFYFYYVNLPNKNENKSQLDSNRIYCSLFLARSFFQFCTMASRRVWVTNAKVRMSRRE